MERVQVHFTREHLEHAGMDLSRTVMVREGWWVTAVMPEGINYEAKAVPADDELTPPYTIDMWQLNGTAWRFPIEQPGVRA